MTKTSGVQKVGQTVTASRSLTGLARLGLTARAVVYLVMGILAIQVANGGGGKVDQRGALTKVLIQPFGTGLVWLLAFGFAAYALWRFAEAIYGVTGEGNRTGPRIESLVRALAYTVLTISALSLLAGSRSTQRGEQIQLAASVMKQDGGRWVVAIVGVIVFAIGLRMVSDGFKKHFLELFGSLPAHYRTAVNWLGRVGTISRGVVFAVVGALVVVAAWTANSRKTGGIDEALRLLLAEPYGRPVVLLLGAGLILFGAYGLAQAKWQRVSDGGNR